MTQGCPFRRFLILLYNVTFVYIVGVRFVLTKRKLTNVYKRNPHLDTK